MLDFFRGWVSFVAIGALALIAVTISSPGTRKAAWILVAAIAVITAWNESK